MHQGGFLHHHIEASRALFAVALLIAAWLVLNTGTDAYAQNPCDPAVLNPIVCENSLPGSPSSEWDISGAGSATIQGFASDISVNQGETVHFKVDTDASAYRLDIYRMGYYGGTGARKVATVRASVPLPQSQPDCLVDGSTGLIDCGNWAESASWTVPPDATSGIYFAKLVRESGVSGASHIVFVVRDDDGRSDLLFQTSDTTWQAYNNYGGNSLYVGSPAGRAYKVSYNRPFNTRATNPEDWLFNAEYPMVRWLEANGYDVSYFTGVDSDRMGQEIRAHQVFLSVGHDEYWSAGQRANVEAARNVGVHLAFFSGNEVFWKTRWESSIDGAGTPYRTLVSYKETHANAKIDPLPNVWTGTWRDPRFSPPADGGRPENALTGTIFKVNCCSSWPTSTAITVPQADGKMRFWRNTSIATLGSGQTATLSSRTLGYEWDEDLDNDVRPAGLIRLSTTTVSGLSILLDYGSTYGSGAATHRLTLYRAPSGALVFGAGTVEWSWGLDGNHDGASSTPDVRMRQSTVNLLADMGVQPDTLQSGLVAATASTDNAPPISTITSPAAGSTVPSGSPVTISGTAIDAGGGVVGGVEVSVDGGATWHPATGRETWSYSWTPTGQGAVTLMSRAADDSGHLESSPQITTVSVGGQGSTCPCSIWSAATVPAVAADPDVVPLEVGVKFRASVNGYITGLRFYKSTTNTGTHVGNLWTASGTRLATATFINETASGWQQVALSPAVQITVNATYVASYHTNTGRYAVDEGYFATGITNGPLQALANGVDGPNGVYVYGASAFPTQTYNATNYWVDVVFATTAPADSSPPTVSSTTVPGGSNAADPSGNITITFNEAMDPGTINGSTIQLLDAAGNVVPATVTYDAATRTATLNPTGTLDSSTTYTLVVKGGSSGVKDAAGNALAADSSSSFTTAASSAAGSPDQGPGGPILIVATASNPFSRYYAEILRTEGLNVFTVSDLSSISAPALADYDVVILSAMPLTAAQVAMFSDWVNAGGKLIAMRPDKQLAGLLGLTDAASILADAYLLMNTSSGPGVGLVSQTIQFHGIADRYTLSGASSLATLYASASTATPNPAVTLRSVGPNGGQAAAFTYDLALSVVDMHQGNTAWAGQERDGLTPIRSDDLFFGNASGDPRPDWVDLNKVAIPQADEQQRLLANLILHMNRDKKPLPRFWYFPRGFKAVVIMTGDDHATGGTAGRFEQYIASSPSGCSVADWGCIRSTSYIYPTAPLTNAQAVAYVAQGFEVGLHITTGCDNWTTPSELESFYSDQLNTFAAIYPSVPAPTTNRTHCIVWSDYMTQPQVELAHGIRLDTNYYYWPPSWLADRPGFFTGSGMPMRFALLDGSMIDVYQATTQMTDESGQTFPFTVNALLDKAIGPEGYYGAFTANMHTDQVSSGGSDAIIASAQARGVPVVSARQMLTWLDGRNGSSFGSLAWSGGTLGFSIATAPGANGLQAMLPRTAAAGTLTGITRNGSPISYTTQAIKGMDYAFFPALAGTYQATYASDTAPPTVSSTSVPGGSSAADPGGNITITFSEAMDPSTINGSTILLQDASGNLVPATVTYDPATHTATLNPTGMLAASTTYTLVVKGGSGGVKDAAGNALASDTTSSFTTAAAPSCPCSIWSDATTPAVTATSDAASVELGVKFRATVDGSVTGVRFYKGAGNSGTHTGHLWTAGGTLLATATFTSETASGWQQASFSTPVAITANTTYVVSYYAPVGRYAANGAYFAAAGVTNGPLRALANGEDGGNGVYNYGASGFPTQSFNTTNYWVDVVFTTGVPPASNPVPATSGLVPNTTTAGGGAFTLTVNGSNFLATSVVRWNGVNRPTTFVSATQVQAAIPATDIAQTGTASVTVFNPAPGGGTSNPQTFTTTAGASTFTDTTVADFSAGTPGTATYVGQSANGEVLLAPTVGAEFAGSSLPAGWTATPWSTGGTATVGNGQLTVNGARAGTVALFTGGRSVEFVATFSGSANQHVGFGVSFGNTEPWAVFSTNTGNSLWARTRVGSTNNNTQIPGNWLGTPHRFRIDWNTSNVVYSIDGAVVATHARTLTASMRPLASDSTVGGGTVVVDWLRMTPYAATGTFTSRVFDAGSSVPWGRATWTNTLPAGTSVSLSVRQGNTPTPDGNWTPFTSMAGSGATIGGSARYLQYRATLTTTVPGQTPTLHDVTLTSNVGGL